jgi:hypothetical protein
MWRLQKKNLGKVHVSFFIERHQIHIIKQLMSDGKGVVISSTVSGQWSDSLRTGLLLSFYNDDKSTIVRRSFNILQGKAGGNWGIGCVEGGGGLVVLGKSRTTA